jgi:hypothetical protein
MRLRSRNRSKRQKRVFGSDAGNHMERLVWTGRDLNPRPLPCEGSDLPADLPALNTIIKKGKEKILFEII